MNVLERLEFGQLGLGKRLRGLDVSRRYKVTFDNTGTSSVASGFNLKQQGIRLDLSRPLTSELLLFEMIS